MGMYTEFHFNVGLLEDCDPQVIRILEFMVGDRKTVDLLPDHPLFSEDTRWQIMLRCDSYYFAADTHSTLRWDIIANRFFLNIRCNLKNYNDEIALFLDWIMPHIEEDKGEFLGFYRYEEVQEPTLIYAFDGGIKHDT